MTSESLNLLKGMKVAVYFIFEVEDEKEEAEGGRRGRKEEELTVRR